MPAACAKHWDLTQRSRLLAALVAFESGFTCGVCVHLAPCPVSCALGESLEVTSITQQGRKSLSQCRFFPTSTTSIKSHL